MPSDPVLGQAAASDRIPSAMTKILRVQLVLNRLSSAFREQFASILDEQPSCGSLISSFEHELKQLERDLGADQTSMFGQPMCLYVLTVYR
jgi:hypothetical protein